MDPTTEELKLMRHHINRPPDAGGGKHSRSSTQLSIAGEAFSFVPKDDPLKVVKH